MKRLKTGLIGCGKVADLHACALDSLPESQFTAVCASTAEKGEKFAARYGVRGYGDVEEMLEESGVEAVCICTPHPKHADPVVAAAQRGIHVLVEKPLASSLADCDRMIAAARQTNVTLGSISQRRFYEPCRRIRAAIDAGKIGTPILGSVAMYGWRDEKYYAADPWRGSWRGEGGGVLVNQAPHQLDLLLWYMGPVAELCGYWANFNHPYIEVEDTAIAIIRFQTGALGHIVVSNSQNPALYGRVQVHGSNGASVGVQTDGGAMFIAGVSKIAEPPCNDIWTIPGESDHRVGWQKEDAEFFAGINPMEHYHRLQIQDFLSAILANRPLLVTAEDGRRTVELFTAIYLSQQQRAPVRFPLSGDIVIPRP
jgi:UDP-N-acetyl-2-amino-2-deoxyglucuronate dehydrogenase